MSGLDELERENSEYVDTKAGITAANGFIDCGAQTAIYEMCTFLVMNISSLQLIPVNIIAYRSQYGSSWELKSAVWMRRMDSCSTRMETRCCQRESCTR